VNPPVDQAEAAPVRRLAWTPGADPEPLVAREWLVTNGLGGYGSGSLAGATTRRYHGVLVSALPAPVGRVVMLSHLSEQVRLPSGTTARLGGEEDREGGMRVPGAEHLTEFALERGLPVWRFRVEGHLIEKQIFMVHLQNTVHVRYRLVGGEGPVRLKLRPAVHFRHYEAPVSEPLAGPYAITAVDDRYEIACRAELPTLRLRLQGQRQAFTVECRAFEQVLYQVERDRGYDDHGPLWSPGYFRVDLTPGQGATLIASTESWETLTALDPDAALDAERIRRERLLESADPGARTGIAAELVLAADSFIMTPAGRAQDAARAHAQGDEVRSVIAGYHWFTDWGRDTMISLEGLTLCTGRQLEAGYILRTFAHHVRDGLIPNMFPDGKNEGLYNTADATLWFFHALSRYLLRSGDAETLSLLLPTLEEIVARHLAGTRFGIGVADDGLLRQGAEGYQLTWMDAKVDGWVVTPRRGKAVEINALWFNALTLLAGWVRDARGEAAARPYAAQAARAQRSFNARFWYAAGNHLFDVVDGEDGTDDPACRPNQLFAVSLDHPVLARDRWAPVVETVRTRLLTTVGLRSLAPGHPDYKPRYFGDLRSRDAAYHQGTVWGWLVGPFVDAWLKLHPTDVAGARGFLEGFVPHLDAACVGSISEVFDAEAPFTARGCCAQAWSVAEVLRAWLKTAS
jgi:predicted glycogen debranching enzyme